jgi:5-methylcytosine-specific restriction endonuclease McrA
MLKGKAEPLHFLEDNYLNTVGEENIIRPTVLRLNYQIKRKYTREYKVSRLGIYNRDNHTCQYCGVKNNELTLDHVYPRHLGGRHEWENLVTSCASCNQKKAGKTLDQSGMVLSNRPKVPRYSFNYLLQKPINNEDEYWKFYLA